ncbi:MAG: aminotransferase class I/II-fold pyridoxal phosphate-dependent enzyme [Gemmatimonadetes bacterium]|nr:aminotransferase class I/II-fold pyridoxal phosphate-dependent enzyme [Gemmatimonadota bacterium]
MRNPVVIERAERLHQVPLNRPLEHSRYLRRLAARGIEPIDLTTGSTETSIQPETMERSFNAMATAGGPDHPGGPGGPGGPADPAEAGRLAGAGFRRVFSNWFAYRFDVEIDPDVHVLPFAGAAAGPASVAMALVNPGETVLVPDPSHPAYRTSAVLANGQIHPYPLYGRNDFLPNLKQIESGVAGQAKLMYIGYPNDPTGAVADHSFFRELVDFARRHNIIVCHDATQHFLTYDGIEAPSLLQTPGAMNLGIELFSLSVLPGGVFRDLSVAVGNPSALAAMSQLTSHLHAPLLPGLQAAAAAVFPDLNRHVEEAASKHQLRRDLMVSGLRDLGWNLRAPRGGPYVWLPVPPRYSSVRFSVLLRKAGVFVVPGVYLGEYGEGYVRMAFNVNESQIQTVLERIDRLMSRFRLRKRAFPAVSLA